jgi:hypothetical protein
MTTIEGAPARQTLRHLILALRRRLRAERAGWTGPWSLERAFRF